ncbi:ABC-three component system middle component 6 [Rhizobium leguminosarum]
MILPTKYLSADRSLIAIGAEIIKVLSETPRSVSEVWERVTASRNPHAAPLTYDWFLLAVTLLYAIGTVDMRGGLLAIVSGAKQ